MKDEPVLFLGGGYNCFSNLSSYSVEIDGMLFMTSEHAYQSAKFFDTLTKVKIINARSGYDAKMIAEENIKDINPQWDNIKFHVMELILREKLNQHPHIQKKLLETGNRDIIEASDTDSFWGWGSDKKGQNNHGKIWMKLREELIKNGKVEIF